MLLRAGQAARMDRWDQAAALIWAAAILTEDIMIAYHAGSHRKRCDLVPKMGSGGGLTDGERCGGGRSSILGQ